MPSRETGRESTIYYRIPGSDEFIEAEEIKLVQLFADSLEEKEIAKWIYSGTFKLRLPRSRKRFVKLLMANGYSRNKANKFADHYNRYGYSWGNAFINLTLGL